MVYPLLYMILFLVQLTDKREVHYEDKRMEVFAGSGQTLGGDHVPSRLVPTKLQDRQVSNVFKTQPVDDEEDVHKRQTTSELPGNFIVVLTSLFFT